MNSIHLENLQPVTPNAAEALLAKETSRRLAALLGDEPEYRMQLLEDGHPSETLAVPASAMRLFVHLLSEMAKGHAVTLIPVNEELSTQQAADLLHVSRPFLIQLLEKGEIPFHKVGAHRRIRFSDLMTYKQETYAKRRQALDDLAAYDQELGLQ